ncbi:MAG: hypothetical protein WCX71_00635 [Candidatus Buchananbacteria bacterium]
MDIVIDFSGIPTENPIAFGWWFFKNIGWIYPVFLIVAGMLELWKNWLKTKYREARKYIVLAVDVPKNIENGPQSVEHIFNQLSGAQQGIGRYEKWWTGEIPDSFSFELISVGGYIQFMIHTCVQYRDLVEAIVYAQYPDAEIMEVQDYVNDYKKIRFPNDEYELWGTELRLAKKEFYPIRTYPEFEHSTEGFKDSMAGLLEALTRIGPGEQIWVQLVITPADNSWIESAKIEVKKLIGAKVEQKKTWADKVFDFPDSIIKTVSESIALGSGAEASKPAAKSDDPPSKIQHMSYGEKVVVEGVEKKISKIGFHTKIRLIYLAEKTVFNKVTPKIIMGGFKQFNTLNMNSFKADPKSKTGGMVFLKKNRSIARKNKIIYRYKNRGHFLEPGVYGQILNCEELATIYHFPTLNVKAPMLKKSEAKKAEPPISLPIEVFRPVKLQENTSTVKAEPPTDLPIG